MTLDLDKGSGSRLALLAVCQLQVCKPAWTDVGLLAYPVWL